MDITEHLVKQNKRHKPGCNPDMKENCPTSKNPDRLEVFRVPPAAGPFLHPSRNAVCDCGQRTSSEMQDSHPGTCPIPRGVGTPPIKRNGANTNAATSQPQQRETPGMRESNLIPVAMWIDSPNLAGKTL